MPFTLYDAFVPTSRQILTGLGTLIDRGEAHAKEHGLDDAELIEARLAEDMWTLPWHVRSCWLHGAQTLEQLPGGEFSPDFTDIPASWDAMRTMVADAKARLDRATPEALDGFAGSTVGFVLGGKRLMELTGADMLLRFNQPNFYFHATTFYDILRMKGVKLGKRDFLGPPPIIQPG